jgi:hypothetical protein
MGLSPLNERIFHLVVSPATRAGILSLFAGRTGIGGLQHGNRVMEVCGFGENVRLPHCNSVGWAKCAFHPAGPAAFFLSSIGALNVMKMRIEPSTQGGKPAACFRTWLDDAPGICPAAVH